MTPRTETDSFVVAQVAPILRSGEQISLCAYLTPIIESGRAASFVSAATRMAAFAALTDQRLILIKTRIGAFKPLLENHGVESIERPDIRGVALHASLLIELSDGQMMEWQYSPSTKAVSTQAEFFRQLPQLLGVSAAATALAQKKKRESGVALLIGIAIAMAYLVYKFF